MKSHHTNEINDINVSGQSAASGTAFETGAVRIGEELLTIQDLSIEYRTDLETVHAVNGISFTLHQGETLGLVGETGAGKTTTALGIMGLLPTRTAKVTGGSIRFDGTEITSLDEHAMERIRGEKISMIFQDPMTALNPVLTVGEQIGEALYLHNTEELSQKEIDAKVEETLELVGIPKERKTEYPYQFSGGMRQRVVIAIALVCNPALLIADEPTTALDVTIQAQILSMICDLQRRYSTSVIMITHDLGVVAETCDQVGIMYAGEIIEYGKLADIFTGKYHHPYTEGLFGSIPNLTEDAERLHPIEGLMPDPTKLPQGCSFAPRCDKCMDICHRKKPGVYEENGHQIRCHLFTQETVSGEDATRIAASSASANSQNSKLNRPAKESSSAETMTSAPMPESSASAAPAGGTPLLEAVHVKKYFKTRSGLLHAVDDVSFTIEKGKTVGVVGESGCGKSTLGRTLLRLHEATEGQILFNGRDIQALNKRDMKLQRPKMQMIFQEPYASLNGRMTVQQLIAEPLIVNKVCRHRDEIEDRVRSIMDTVGLSQRLAMSYPHELDGGRRQRIGVARALVMEPEFVVCDEPVSALDVSIQAQILNLLMDLQDQMGLTYLFITHDLSVVRHISDEIMVMYLGRCVEKAPADEIFRNPLHPYTKALLAAIPIPSIDSQHKIRHLLQGEVTSPVNPKPGCRFAARCTMACEACRTESLELREAAPGHFVECPYVG